MASTGNPNQPLPPQTQQSGPPFDMHKLFRPVVSPNLNPSLNYLNPSSSYPPPTGPYPFHPQYLPYQQQHLAGNMNAQRPIYPTSPLPNPNSGGARLMSLLSNQNPPPPSNLEWQQPPLPFPPSPVSPGASDYLMPLNPATLATISSSPSVNLVAPQPSPLRMLSSKVPKGRHLMGDHVLYDVNVRLNGEVQPQLEVTPITKYTSDPGLVLGRQIAVNRTYICYGLKLGNIRVLNINTALRSLLRGHTQRVTDMAFFAEDVHLLASASVDGRVFIWKINEGPDEENKPQITGKVVIAIQFGGDWESVHPRLCWHPHKQEILMVAIGNCVLKIDTTRVGKSGGFSAEEPLKCPIDKLIDGIQLVGKHGGEVTDLTMCQWMISRLASASADGTVMVWEDRKDSPVTIFKPHNGPVNSVTFLTAPDRPDHIVLITAGLLNREMKIWTSASEEGWLLPGDTEAWLCTQTLELKSSSEARVEDAFFNQVVALPRAGLCLLANAKKNAIYAVHIDYGNYPAATRMDYISEFTVTMPILSLTGTSDTSPDGEHIVQVYCVQTQAIQQYALELSQCLPPPMGNMELEKTESNVSRAMDVVNADGFSIPELSTGGKSTEMSIENESSIPHTLSSSSEVAQLANRPVNLASSEVSSLSDFVTSGLEIKPSALPSRNNAENIHTVLPLPLSPRLSRKSSDFRSTSNGYESSLSLSNNDGDQPVLNYSVERRQDTLKEDLADVPSSCDNLGKGNKHVEQSDKSMVPNPSLMFKHPTHLVTPSEILSTAASSSENSQGMNIGEEKLQDVVINSDAESIEVEVKVVGGTGTSQNDEFDSQPSYVVAEKKDKSDSQALDLGIRMAGDCCLETYTTEGIHKNNDVCLTEAEDRPAHVGEEEVQDARIDESTIGESEIKVAVPQVPVPATKGKRQKGKTSQVSGTSSASASVFNSTDSSNEPSSSLGAPSTDGVMPQLLAVHEMLEQLMSSQKELQKQMHVMVSVPVAKEGRRLEASLGRSMEKSIKTNTDALWARFQEENIKKEKLERERTQQMINMISTCLSKDLPSILEKILKKEIALIGPAVARSVTPVLEKIISSAISESFQKGVGEKAVNQLEKLVSSKLEATVARQIQTQFQTSGKQVLQDALRSTLEATIIPAFEMSCKSMFEKVDATFQNGFVKHTAATQQHFESTHSPLAIALRDAINSASSMSRTLSGELAENQRKLLVIAAAGASSKVGNPVVTQLSNGPLHKMAEAPLDPTKELSRLIAEHKFEEAFTAALHRSDVSIVSWLCSQVDLQGILSSVPLPLSQGVLLALLQQLACDINKETPKKLAWMRDVAVAVNPTDHLIAMHVRPIFEQVYQILGHQLNLPTTSSSEATNIRLLMHVINSLMASK